MKYYAVFAWFNGQISMFAAWIDLLVLLTSQTLIIIRLCRGLHHRRHGVSRRIVISAGAAGRFAVSVGGALDGF